MTLDEFKQLDWEDMEEYVKNNGVQIGKRESVVKQYTLYQLKDFYVEYEFEDNDLLTNINSFVSLNPLEPYLNDIDIDEIENKKPE